MLSDSFLSLRDEKDEQEDSAQAPHYWSIFLRKSPVYKEFWNLKEFWVKWFLVKKWARPSKINEFLVKKWIKDTKKNSLRP